MKAHDKSFGSLGSILFKVELPVMIDVPAGPFFMGTSDEQVIYLLSREEWAHEWYENDLFLGEQPQTTVDLPTFQIAKFPVTNYDYYVFIFKSGYKLPKSWTGFRYPDETDNHPIAGVSKMDALAYIEWLNKQSKSNYRLPTEAEWEKASRGSEDSRIYPWGDEFDPWRCNTMESSKGGTTALGSYSPSGDSPYGVADMVGNVWEWTSSLMLPYPYDPHDGREDPKGSGKTVVRGGAWYYSKKLARCSSREGLLSGYISNSLGFRLARDV
jgi:toxoflavin biosynthesis protein ToxD